MLFTTHGNPWRRERSSKTAISKLETTAVGKIVPGDNGTLCSTRDTNCSSQGHCGELLMHGMAGTWLLGQQTLGSCSWSRSQHLWWNTKCCSLRGQVGEGRDLACALEFGTP